ncbi:MAG: hypothetical protein ABI068_00810 [Ktedonobacterales bacterium]
MFSLLISRLAMQHRRLAYGWLTSGLAVLLVAMLAGCGTQGYAAALGKTVHAAFTNAQSKQQLGSVTLTPFYALHAVTYYQGIIVPYTNTHTPVELRRGACNGPIITSLTQATSQPLPTSAQGIAIQPDAAAHGVNVALEASTDLWVTVRAQPNNPNAAILACGNPLTGRQQYFDLYPPSVGDNGTALGMALLTPLTATRVQVKLAQPASAATHWAVRSGSCAGAILDSGQIAAGATTGGDVIFRTLDTSHWRVTLTPEGQNAVCATLGV